MEATIMGCIGFSRVSGVGLGLQEVSNRACASFLQLR